MYIKLNRVWRFRLQNYWQFWRKEWRGCGRKFCLFNIETDFKNRFKIVIFNFDFLFYKLRSYWK